MLQQNAVENACKRTERCAGARTALSQGRGEKRTDLPRPLTEDPVRTAILIASAGKRWKDFSKRICPEEVARRDEDRQRSGLISQHLRGTLPLPVQGRMLVSRRGGCRRRFKRSRIFCWRRVRAPCHTGRRQQPQSVTAGHFLDYGKRDESLKTQAGTLFVLAGLGNVVLWWVLGEVIPCRQSDRV